MGAARIPTETIKRALALRRQGLRWDEIHAQIEAHSSSGLQKAVERFVERKRNGKTNGKAANGNVATGGAYDPSVPAVITLHVFGNEVRRFACASIDNALATVDLLKAGD